MGLLDLVKSLFAPTEDSDRDDIIDFKPGTRMTNQGVAGNFTVPQDAIAEVLAARTQVLAFLRAGRTGADRDATFASSSLNALGLSSIDFAEILLAQSEEWNIDPDRMLEFLAHGTDENRREANLLKRVLLLAQFNPEERYVLLASGAVGNGAELAPFRSEFDSVDALESFCAAVENWCRR